MKVELHLIQNFAPSCLNRDDTNTPKDCEFGGYRRARISSQCIKRAIRWDSGFGKVLESNSGVRTRRLIVEIAEQVAGKRPAPEKVVKSVSDIFKEGGIERPKRGEEEGERDNTKLILFMDSTAIAEMTDLFKTSWGSLNKGDEKTRAKIVEELGEVLTNGVKAPDIALFGRMIEIDAKKPFGKKHLNVDAACQVAHAISTNKVLMDMDFYTAVDDLQPEAETGAGMMGFTSFNSSCFYRYSLVDVEQLKRNLGGDKELALKTLEAFLLASVTAIPTGKQNSMAAQNRPDAIFAVVREKGTPVSLANAFAIPVRPARDKSLTQASIEAMDNYWSKLTKVYGEDGVKVRPISLVGEAELTALKDQQATSFEELVKEVVNAISFKEEK